MSFLTEWGMLFTLMLTAIFFIFFVNVYDVQEMFYKVLIVQYHCAL